MDIFRPDMYQKSIYTIDYFKLKKNGIKCLLFDLDNTLTPVSRSVPDKKLKEQIETIKDMGFKVIIASNSGKKRVAPFKEQLNIDAAYSCTKPLKRKFKKIMKLYNFKDNEIAIIGDQILTDVLGGNRMGFVTVLINPISTSDFIFTKLNRKIENKIMKMFEKRGIFSKGVYFD